MGEREGSRRGVKRGALGRKEAPHAPHMADLRQFGCIFIGFLTHTHVSDQKNRQKSRKNKVTGETTEKRRRNGGETYCAHLSGSLGPSGRGSRPLAGRVMVKKVFWCCEKGSESGQREKCVLSGPASVPVPVMTPVVVVVFAGSGPTWVRERARGRGSTLVVSDKLGGTCNKFFEEDASEGYTSTLTYICF